MAKARVVGFNWLVQVRVLFSWRSGNSCEKNLLLTHYIHGDIANMHNKKLESNNPALCHACTLTQTMQQHKLQSPALNTKHGGLTAHRS